MKLRDAACTVMIGAHLVSLGLGVLADENSQARAGREEFVLKPEDHSIKNAELVKKREDAFADYKKTFSEPDPKSFTSGPAYNTARHEYQKKLDGFRFQPGIAKLDQEIAALAHIKGMTKHVKFKRPDGTAALEFWSTTSVMKKLVLRFIDREEWVSLAPGCKVTRIEVPIPYRIQPKSLVISPELCRAIPDWERTPASPGEMQAWASKLRSEIEPEAFPLVKKSCETHGAWLAPDVREPRR